MKTECGGQSVVFGKATARGKHKGTVTKTHFLCVLQLCLKDCDASSGQSVIENLP